MMGPGIHDAQGLPFSVQPNKERPWATIGDTFGGMSET